MRLSLHVAQRQFSRPPYRQPAHRRALRDCTARGHSPCIPGSGCSARRRLPSRGSLGPHFPTFLGTMRRDNCHHARLGSLHSSLASRYLACFSTLVVSPTRSWSGRSVQFTPVPLATRSPIPGLWARRWRALSRSRGPLREDGSVLYLVNLWTISLFLYLWDLPSEPRGNPVDVPCSDGNLRNATGCFLSVS